LLRKSEAAGEATYPLVAPVSVFDRRHGGILGPSNQLLGLAGGGVYPASAVTGAAVRSYHTISPLPVSAGSGPSAV